MTDGAQTCVQCRGVFLDPQPDGSRYFHVCGTGTTGAPVPRGTRAWIRGALRRPQVAIAPPPPPDSRRYRMYWEGP